jgi:fructan beta-fructosidase
MTSISTFATSAEPTTDRPLNHFTAERMWINDPNGLIHHNGLYHLYFQANP